MSSHYVVKHRSISLKNFKKRYLTKKALVYFQNRKNTDEILNQLSMAEDQKEEIEISSPGLFWKASRDENSKKFKYEKLLPDINFRQHGSPDRLAAKLFASYLGSKFSHLIKDKTKTDKRGKTRSQAKNSKSKSKKKNDLYSTVRDNVKRIRKGRMSLVPNTRSLDFLTGGLNRRTSTMASPLPESSKRAKIKFLKTSFSKFSQNTGKNSPDASPLFNANQGDKAVGIEEKDEVDEISIRNKLKKSARGGSRARFRKQSTGLMSRFPESVSTDAFKGPEIAKAGDKKKIEKNRKSPKKQILKQRLRATHTGLITKQRHNRSRISSQYSGVVSSTSFLKPDRQKSGIKMVKRSPKYKKPLKATAIQAIRRRGGRRAEIENPANLQIKNQPNVATNRRRNILSQQNSSIYSLEAKSSSQNRPEREKSTILPGFHEKRAGNLISILELSSLKSHIEEHNQKLLKSKKLSEKVKIYKKIQSKKVMETKIFKVRQEVEAVSIDLQKNSMILNQWMKESESTQSKLPLPGASILSTLDLESQLYVDTLFKVGKVVEELEDCLKILKTSSLTQYSFIKNFKDILWHITSMKTSFFSLDLLKFMAKAYILTKNYSQAKYFLEYLIFFSDIFRAHKTLLWSYEAIGTCYSEMGEHHESLQNFIKQLQMAWILSDRSNEIRAYDNIGMQHFYLGNLEKAKSFHKQGMIGFNSLHNHSFAKLLKQKFEEEIKTKNKLFNSKSPMFKFDLMRNVVQSGTFWKSNARFDIYRTNLGPFEDKVVSNAKLPPERKRIAPHDYGPFTSKNSALVVKQTKKSWDNSKKIYTAKWTSSGFLDSIKKSNPLKFDLIEKGIITPRRGERVDLLDNYYWAGKGSASLRRTTKSRYLTHCSRNKTSVNFLGNQSGESGQSEISYDYFSVEIRPSLGKMIFAKILEMKAIIDSILEVVQQKNNTSS